MSEEVKSQESGVVSGDVKSVLVRDEKTEKASSLYDATANIRFPYTITDNGQKYEIAHVFGPLTDERYMQWNRDLKVVGTGDNIEENSREATCALWDDLIVEIDGAEYDANADWKSFIDPSEKVQAINDLLAVAIVDDEAPAAGGKLKLGAPSETQTIITEAFSNGDIVRQRHMLTRSTFELQKRYERIKAKSIKQETTRGLRRAAKIQYVPQDEKFGELYDEMCQNVDGFRLSGGSFATDIPLRFKTAVINYIFAPKLDPKLVGK